MIICKKFQASKKDSQVGLLDILFSKNPSGAVTALKSHVEKPTKLSIVYNQAANNLSRAKDLVRNDTIVIKKIGELLAKYANQEKCDGTFSRKTHLCQEVSSLTSKMRSLTVKILAHEDEANHLIKEVADEKKKQIEFENSPEGLTKRFCQLWFSVLFHNGEITTERQRLKEDGFVNASTYTNAKRERERYQEEMSEINAKYRSKTGKTLKASACD